MLQQRSWIRYYDEDGELVFETQPDADLAQAGQPAWIEPEGLHAVENIGDRTLYAIRVELKTAHG